MPDHDTTRDTPGRRGLSRGQRLLHSSLFEEARAQHRRYAGRWMVLCLRRGPGANMRLGVVASRHIGGAVVRNRAKRRMREAFRECRAMLRGDCDVILLARAGLDRVKAAEAQAEFIKLAGRAGLLDNTGNRADASS